MSDFTATFGKPFPQQLAAWRIRLGSLVPTATWQDLWHAQHDRAFVVAGAMKAELLADLAAAVDKAIAGGGTLESFRKDFRALVEKNGWHGWTGEDSEKGRAWRTKVIYKTNLATSYAAGRLAQLREGGFAFYVYRHGGSVEPRIQHLAWDGLVLDADHPFWATHAPPNGWGCSCYITGARSREGAKRVGGKPGKVLEDGWQALDPKTGAPKGIDKGWAYAPGATVSDDIADLAKVISAKIAGLPPQLGTALAQGRAEVIDRAWQQWVAETMEGISHDPGLAGVFASDLIAALQARGVVPATSAISVKPGLLKGPKADRHAKKGDELGLGTWERLSERLRAPQAVFLDEKTGKLLYILADETGAAQLAVEMDVVHRANRQKSVTNMVVSAYRVKPADLIWRWGGKEITLLTGSLQ